MDWEARIARAKKRGKFTKVDKRLTRFWPSCALGEKAATFELEAYDAPALLWRHGHIFMQQVARDRVAAAAKTYIAIQEWEAPR